MRCRSFAECNEGNDRMIFSFSQLETSLILILTVKSCMYVSGCVLDKVFSMQEGSSSNLQIEVLVYKIIIIKDFVQA